MTLGSDVTALVRDGREVALLSHRPGLLDDPGLAEEVATAARLALENERLRAQAGAQLEDLRASRARVIAAGDSERRRLERDLHDGAQQRLVGLSLSLRLARPASGRSRTHRCYQRIGEADGELRTALDDLREVAHGIFPAVLADEGLGAALEAFAEDGAIPIELAGVPGGSARPVGRGRRLLRRLRDQPDVAARKLVAYRGSSEASARLVVEVETDNAPGGPDRGRGPRRCARRDGRAGPRVRPGGLR